MSSKLFRRLRRWAACALGLAATLPLAAGCFGHRWKTA